MANWKFEKVKYENDNDPTSFILYFINQDLNDKFSQLIIHRSAPGSGEAYLILREQYDAAETLEELAKKGVRLEAVTSSEETLEEAEEKSEEES